MIIPKVWKNKKCSKPPTRSCIVYPLVNEHSYGKSPSKIGKSTINNDHFQQQTVSHYQRVTEYSQIIEHSFMDCLEIQKLWNGQISGLQNIGWRLKSHFFRLVLQFFCHRCLAAFNLWYSTKNAHHALMDLQHLGTGP